MNAPDPRLGDYREPPDGDYASYVERLLQSHAAPGAVQPPLAQRRLGVVVKNARPAAATTDAAAIEQAQRKRAAGMKLLARLALLPWIAFVLLMWFAPALLPFAIGAVVVGGIAYGVWKSKLGPPGGKN
ncbi:MAG: hypothetical protein JSS31_06050 [Proteobacteria bacterium]|nr:hypothetical protein [Pseudomonadota bacterium]MBS0493515.1 hypothetical protein [Pseudomonadota bacterium]